MLLHRNYWCSNMRNGNHNVNTMNGHSLHEQEYEQIEMRGFWWALHFLCVFFHLSEEQKELNFQRNINHFLSSKPHKNAVIKARFLFHLIMDICLKVSSLSNYFWKGTVSVACLNFFPMERRVSGKGKVAHQDLSCCFGVGVQAVLKLKPGKSLHINFPSLCYKW